MNSSISCLYLVYPGEHLKQSILTNVRKFFVKLLSYEVKEFNIAHDI